MSPKTFHSVPAVSIDIHRDMIDVTLVGGERTPDQKWRHTDSNGHLHAWDGDNLPSLEWVVTGQEYIGDEIEGQVYDVGEYRCRSCGEVVEPGIVTDYGRKSMPGPTTVTITIGEEHFTLDETQYAASLEAWLQALRDIHP